MKIEIPTFPARPVNGGQLDLARPKFGKWLYQPKFNGYRAVVHTPSGTMFNRHGGRLSIASKFAVALREVRHTPFEWLDCEGLERRHNIGKGSLIVLDWLDPEPDYLTRRPKLEERFPVLPVNGRLADNSVVIPFETADASGLWASLKEQNKVLGCDFYEGIVGREVTARYPFQLRSDSEEFSGMMKHRWRF